MCYEICGFRGEKPANDHQSRSSLAVQQQQTTPFPRAALIEHL